MPDKTPIGAIRYYVFTDNEQPFICRTKLVSTSPTGASLRWMYLGVEGKPVQAMSLRVLSETPEEAVEKYQLHCMLIYGGMFGKRADNSKGLRRILLAQKLIEGQDSDKGRRRQVREWESACSL